MADDKRIEELLKLLEKNNYEGKSIEELNEDLKRLEDSFLRTETAMEKLGNMQDKINEKTQKFSKTKELFDEHKDKIEELTKIENEYLEKLEEKNKILFEQNRLILKNKLTAEESNRLNQLEKEEELLEQKLKTIGQILENNKDLLELRNKKQKEEKDLVQDKIKLQEESNKLQEEGYIVADDWVKNQEKRFKALNRSVKEISTGFKEMGAAITKTLEPWKKANAASMQYARSMGMSRATAQSMLTETASWAAKNNIGLLFNKSTDELIKMQQKYSEVVGRNVQLTSSQKKDMLALETIIGEDGMMDIANNLENFGLGMSDSAEFIKETMDEATKSGIAASKLTKVIRENIKMAQNYTFKNGLDGLRSMAKKAVELKTDLSVVNGFIDKTSTVEGAITTGAQLQVLGGNYAMASDPLSMMYDSLLNVEGAFDRMVNMTKGKVFYNEKTGNFDMGGMDRYIARQAAAATGIDYNKMMDVAFRNASLDKIKSQIKANPKISGDKEMVDMVANLATWENGEAVVNINGKDTKVSELSSADKEKLEAMQRNDSQNLQEMAINLRSLDDKLTGISKEINNEQASLLNGIGKFTDNLLHNNTYSKICFTIQWAARRL